MKLIYLTSALKCDSFDVSIGIKIPFFRVLITIEPGRSLLQFVTTNCLMASVSKKDFEDFKVGINAKLMKLDKLDIILANQNELSLKFVSLKADIQVIKSDGIERGNRIRELESQLNAHKASCELLSKELLLID